ncbi:MAG: PAS domain-containing sensor histidine kinase [Ignavibacteriae bacterium]|nr:PAS domain-containing sensor histidine kinase [Ignavibacteriota bacterium]
MESTVDSAKNSISNDYAEIEKNLRNIDTKTGEKIRKLINELYVQQIELENQNEELRNIQSEIEIIKNEYFDLYNNAPVGYLVLDDKAIIHKSNICFQNYLDLSASDILNKPLNNFIVEKEDFLSIYHSFFNHPKNKIFDYQFISASNKTFYGRIIGSDFSNSVFVKNNTKKILVIVNDITIQKIFEKKMQEFVLNKSKFISSIAHDIRNPLNSILGYSKFLLDEKDKLNENEIHDCLISINSVSKNLYHFIDNFLDLSKINFDLENITLTNLNQNLIIDEVLNLTSKAAILKNITINFHRKENFYCLCDKFMISTVYRNVISNSIKFTNYGGEINIHCEYKDNQASITISDNGIGMNDDVLKSIFENRKVESTEGTNNEIGSGLGLKICKEYVEKMTGKISVFSESKKGTKFTIILPTRKIKG